MMGIGYLGEVRQGPDGAHYQYVQGVDGLGNPIGVLWRAEVSASSATLCQTLGAIYSRRGCGSHGGDPVPETGGSRGVRRVSALCTRRPMAPCTSRSRVLDDDAELRGLDADDELHGLDDDPELRGFDEGEELHGFDEDTDLRGLEDDMELRGLNDSEDLRGFDEDRDMQGVAGYVRQDGISGLERYELEQPPQTRWHVPPAQQPKVWKRAW